MSSDRLQEELGEWTRSLDTLVDAEASAGREIGVEQVASDVVGWVKGIGKEVTIAASRKITPQLDLRRRHADRVDYRPRHRSWRSLSHPGAASYAQAVLSWFGYSRKEATRSRGEVRTGPLGQQHDRQGERWAEDPDALPQGFTLPSKEEEARAAGAACLRERSTDDPPADKHHHARVRQKRHACTPSSAPCSAEWQKCLACFLYYLFQGTIFIFFVTDNVRDVVSLRSVQKQVEAGRLLGEG
eukprot:240900-Hanusia_phi.AAC.1